MAELVDALILVSALTCLSFHTLSDLSGFGEHERSQQAFSRFESWSAHKIEKGEGHFILS